MQQLELSITGMSCHHCLNAVRNALSGVPGVEIETVQMGRARVAFDPTATTEEKIANAIRDEGYEPAVTARG